MLGDEYGTASNIKSRVNRLSVLSAITSAQQKLKLYTKVRLGGRGVPDGPSAAAAQRAEKAGWSSSSSSSSSREVQQLQQGAVVLRLSCGGACTR